MHFLRTLKPPRFHRRGVVRALPKIISIAGAVAIGFHFGWPLITRAASDTVAPQLVSGSPYNGSNFDVSDTKNLAQIVFNATDDLSGINIPRLKYTSPTARQSQAADCFRTLNDNEFICNLEIPQYSETGTWTPELTIPDNSGNVAYYNATSIAGMGINISLRLTGTSDTTAPVLSAVKNSLSSVNTTNSSAIVQAVAAITDNLAGVAQSTIYYTSPSKKQSVNGIIAGSDDNGNTIMNVEFPQYSENGTWTPSMVIQDYPGNSVTLTSANLQSLGINIPVTVSGTSDTVSPTVNKLNITVASPAIDSIPVGGAAISFAADFTDNVSGIGVSTISYVSPSGREQSQEAAFGPDENGVYRASTTLPTYSEKGTWDARLVMRDNTGNTTTYTGSQLSGMGFPININVAKNITAKAIAGQTVSSDEENDGATSTDPVEVAVTTPIDGDISLVTVASDSISGPTNGYSFFDRQISIVAPTTDAQNPLTLAFTVDSSKVPAGQSEQTLQITRNGQLISACEDQTTATPDPCIFSRTKLSGGDIIVKVHSTHASSWSSGFPVTQAPKPTFVKFEGITKDAPALNKVSAGSVVPVMFQMKDTTDNNVIMGGYPFTQEVSCKNLSPIGKKKAATSLFKGGVTHVNDHYQYWWRTSRSQFDSCQSLTFKYIDGTVKTAYYDF